MLPSKSKILQRRPWEYFRDHFWVTFWFEKVGPKKLLETIGVDKVMFETDFPHPTSLYPGVQEHIVETLGGYDHERAQEGPRDQRGQALQPAVLMTNDRPARCSGSGSPTNGGSRTIHVLRPIRTSMYISRWQMAPRGRPCPPPHSCVHAHRLRLTPSAGQKRTF